MPRPKRVASIHSFRLMEEDEALYRAWLARQDRNIAEGVHLRMLVSGVLREMEI